MPINSETYFLKGKCKWFRPDVPSKFGKWEHVLYPNPESLAIIHKLKEGTEKAEGIKNRIMKDDDGYYVRIGRKTKMEPRNGIPIPLRPPEVFQADGKTPLRDTWVGNGSDVTTKVDVYTYNLPDQKGKKGKAWRWESTRIDNLIPYESRNQLDNIARQEEPNF